MSGWSTLPSPERRWTPRLPERETKVNEWNRPRNALRSGAGFVRLREKNQPESRLVQTGQS